MSSIPLFKSHYSIGRSILTLSEADTSKHNEPDSIIDLCKENDLKEMFMVEDCLAGFLEAYKHSKAIGLKLRFGVRITILPDMTKKEPESRAEEAKYVIFVRNMAGYEDLIKIYTKAATEGFYYQPRIDFKTLKSLWSTNLALAVPFYDSFIYRNSMSFSSCIPDFTFADPTFFIEDNDLPFDGILNQAIKHFDPTDKYEKLKTKSIYYRKKEDFLAYLTFRCVENRTILDAPELSHMSSHEFCMESWRIQNGL